MICEQTPITPTVNEHNPDIPTSFKFQTTPITKPTTYKRNLSEIATPYPEDTPDINNSSEPKSYFLTPVPKVPKKKLKSKDKPLLEFRELPQKITNLIDNHNPKFLFDNQQFTDMLENTHGSNDALSIGKDYTLHIPSLIEMIHEIHTQAEDRNMKIKYRRQLRQDIFEKLKDRFNRTGSVNYKKHERTKTSVTEINEMSVLMAVTENPLTSIRSISKKQELSYYFVQNILSKKKDAPITYSKAPRIK
ncbi:unnamed protein product [Diabrotica balteata]|uniref:Uncharacterized protein n=1 Tax=Diabrotica balteata TaxID=107213 RepID=A0A9N9T9P8_DIABA|nr:unnamed protein product [Diabrotica balteata]